MLYRTPLFALAGLAALLASVPARAERTQDVFYGSRTVGPFTLTWKRIAAGTETVQINSLPQTRGMDYTLDTETGALTLTRPLPAQSAVAVAYEYDAGHAERQGGTLSVPLAWDLARTERGTLSLSALYRGAGTASGAAPGTLTLGLGGGWKGEQSRFDAKMLFAPALASTDARQTPNDFDRLGLSLGGAADVTRLARFSFGYTRAGLGLGAAAGENGMQAGTQVWTLGGRLAPSRQLVAIVDYTQSDPTGGKDGKATARLATALTYAPASALQLQTHWTQHTGGQDADVSLNAKPTGALSLQANVAQAEANGATTQTAALHVGADPNKTTQLAADFTAKNGPGDKSDAQAVTLSAKAAPTQSLALEANIGQADSGTDGTTQTANVTLNASPNAATHLEAAVSARNADGEAHDAQAINLAAAVTPGKTLSLTATANQSRQGAASVDRQEVRVALNPGAALQLQTGLALKQTNQFDTTVATFGATARPAAFLQFAALYRDRNAPAADQAASDTLDTGTAQITLTPVKGLRLTGTYAQNPDSNGADPQRLAQRGLGLETALGALSLAGGYDWSQQGQGDAATVGTALRLGIGLRFSRALQLSGDYTQTLTGSGAAPTGSSLYTVGLTHNLGERFNLSMTGTRKQPLGPSPVAASPDYTANANLGMKF